MMIGGGLISGKVIPKTDKKSQQFWDSVAEVAKEVATWPAWKRGGMNSQELTKSRERITERQRIKKLLRALTIEDAHWPEAIAAIGHRADYLQILNAGILAGYKAALRAIEKGEAA